MSKKREVRKFLFLIRYLIEEELECKSICDIARRELEDSIRQAHYDMNAWDSHFDAASQESPCNKKPSDKEEVEDKDDHPRWIKKVYKKIALVTHPDKIPQDADEKKSKELLDSYKSSIEALDKSDYARILIIADDNDIDLDTISGIDVGVLKKREKELSQSIVSLKQSMFWQWSISSEEEKEGILREFIRSRGWETKEGQRKKSKPGKNPGKSISQSRRSKVLKK